MKFLFISASDLYGGANIMAYNQHSALIKKGFRSTMVVAFKKSNDPSVIELNGSIKKYYKNLLFGKYYFPGSYRLGKLIRTIYNLFYNMLKAFGREIYFFPASHKILSLLDYNPDIIHLNSFYNDYFDIRLLRKWHIDYKIVITLHDLWIFTGHCGLPLDCDGWLHKCGNCPHLDYQPSVPLDKTEENKKFKDNIFQKLQINFISPSQWVNDEIHKLGKNLNQNGMHTVVTNSIDTTIFRPGNKQKNREKFNLATNDFIIMACAVGFKTNHCKDLVTILEAFNKLKSRLNENLIRKHISLMIVGESSKNYKNYKRKDIFFMGSISHGKELAKYYQASDIFIHSSPMEPWGLTTSEALSTGLPVLAANIGGLIEQVKGYCFDTKDEGMKYINNYSLEEANGIIYERGNVETLSKSIKFIYENKNIYNSLSTNAREYALQNLSIDKKINNYLEFYSKL